LNAFNDAALDGLKRFLALFIALVALLHGFIGVTKFILFIILYTSSTSNNQGKCKTLERFLWRWRRWTPFQWNRFFFSNSFLQKNYVFYKKLVVSKKLGFLNDLTVSVYSPETMATRSKTCIPGAQSKKRALKQVGEFGNT
jgi:hypothetical protein